MSEILQLKTKVSLATLRVYGEVYLASPYTKYPKGHDQAFMDVVALQARLLANDILAYSPIVHGHAVACCAKMDVCDDIWIRLNRKMLPHFPVLLVAEMEGWKESAGVTEEIATMQKLDNKVIYYINPNTLAVH
jgi:hypothetical protein